MAADPVRRPKRGCAETVFRVCASASEAAPVSVEAGMGNGVVGYWAGLPARSGRRVAALAIVAVTASPASWGQVQPQWMNGPPVLPKPTWYETGLDSFMWPLGTPAVPSAPTGTPAAGTGGGSASISAGGSSSLDTMQSRSWGTLAAQNASALGVNPSAIAAVCMMESNCQNVAARPGSTINGAFQFTDGTYTAAMNKALAQNPALAGTIDTSLAGKMDPANQAIAAAQELKNAAAVLQSRGIANPTVLDTRGYFQFGAAPGPALALAGSGQNMSEILSTYYSASDLAKNGISSTTTVGEWRDRMVAKVGDAAYQTIRI